MYVSTERNILTESLDGWEEVLLEKYRSGNHILEVGEHDIQCTLNKQEVLAYNEAPMETLLPTKSEAVPKATMSHHLTLSG